VVDASTIISCSMQPKLEQIRGIRHELLPALQHLPIPETRIHQIITCMSEWIGNCIIHSKVTPTVIRITLNNTVTGWELQIDDDASAFLDLEERLRAPTPDLLAENGKGLALIYELCPNYRYLPQNKTAAHNRFVLPIDAKPSIALVEDDKALCQVLKLYLQQDYEVRVFHEATSFLHYARTHRIDLVISDIRMPQMDGLQLKRELSAERNTDLIPFVFLTGQHNPDYEERANNLGIDDFLHKPISKQQLISVIKRVLRRQQQSRQAMGALMDEQVTAALRPSLPTQLQQFQTQTVSQSAQAGGGDYIVHLPGSHQDLIILGDVMGHGLQAKFYAHLYAGYLQGVLHNLDVHHPLGESLAKVSQFIGQDPYLESVTTTCLAVACKSNGDIELASAGHPPPLVIGPLGLSVCETQGSMPGLEMNPHYESLTFTLGKNRLLLYTDGLFDVGNNAIEREKTKTILEKVIAESYFMPLEPAAKFILQHWKVQRDTCSHTQDDVTFILISHEKA
jgi:sigma-B regulation protein RsbU (phosphoserine phosphatase)